MDLYLNNTPNQWLQMPLLVEEAGVPHGKTRLKAQGSRLKADIVRRQWQSSAHCPNKIYIVVSKYL
jgi:hypothetical protein